MVSSSPGRCAVSASRTKGIFKGDELGLKRSVRGNQGEEDKATHRGGSRIASPVSPEDNIVLPLLLRKRRETAKFNGAPTCRKGIGEQGVGHWTGSEEKTSLKSLPPN